MIASLVHGQFAVKVHSVTGFGHWLRFLSLLFYLAVAGAAHSQQLLVANDTQVRGQHNTLELPLIVTGPQAQMVKLQMKWAHSSLVDPKRSVVNVLVDGQVRATRRLADVSTAGWILSLRPLAPGAHTLSLQLHLRPMDEDCLPLPEAMWWTLLNSSTVDGATRVFVEANRAQAIPVRDYPNHWTQLRKPTLKVDSAVQAPAVMLSHDFTWDKEMAGAYLQAQLFLRMQSIQPLSDTLPNPTQTQTAVGSATATPRLRLLNLDRVAPTHPAAIRWQQEPDTEFVIYTPTQGQLELIARTPSDLLLGLKLLADDTRRALCTQALCSSTRTVAKLGTTPALRTATAPVLLWQMQNGDRPRGWVAEGIGSHKLRQIWFKPVMVEMQSSVQMQIAARFSKSNQVDRKHSTISLKINDQILATYSLDQWSTDSAQIRIPPNLWAEKVWVIDFEVRMLPLNTQRCATTIQEDFWVAIEPKTQLLARYKLLDSPNIAGFWQRGLSKAINQVVWLGPTGSLPQPSNLDAALPIFLALSNPDQTAMQRWQFVDRLACESSPCLLLHARGEDKSAGKDALLQVAVLDKDLSGVARALPRVHAKGAAMLAWAADQGGQAERLHVLVGDVDGEPLPMPNASTFDVPVAVHTDKWHLIGDVTRAKTNPDGSISEGEGNVSQQQGRLRWVNLIWAMLSIALCTALAVSFWRRKRKANPKNWEVM